MTSIATMPLGSTAGELTPPTVANAVEFHYTQDENFVAVLHELGASLVITTYQANKVLVARVAGAGLSTLVRTFERPMGLAASGDRLALGCRDQIWEFRSAPDIAPQIEPVGQHDACFVPRASHVTGDIGVHELAFAGDELWLVNTRFSCLCTLDPSYSFVPRWRPPFVTALAAEDRCHLNGLAIVNGRPTYVTALGTTDVRDGWRVNKAQGGCVIDVASGELVTRGLSMPHSPRWHEGQLWVLESGTGRLVLLDPATGHRDTLAELPGFARGLVICENYAFVGLSKIRPTSAMDGVPLAERRDELKCGVAVVDLIAGRVSAMLEFQTAVEEIFDVQLLAGVRFPDVMGFQQDTVRHTFVIPPEEQPPRPSTSTKPASPSLALHRRFTSPHRPMQHQRPSS
jgi:uncharacterized protein (TIGR03032 family)